MFRCLRSLTYLQLSGKHLKCDSAFTGLSALKELHLEKVTVHKPSLNILAASLPSLTVLQLRDPWLDYDYSLDNLRPVPNLQ